MMIDKLKLFFYKEQFDPSFFGIFINPFYIARKGLSQNIRMLASRISGKVLDVGCGTKPYEYFFDSLEYIGLELDTPKNRLNRKADYLYDGIYFPFSDGEFDSVVANQVLEHIFSPDIFLSEISRVMKKSGYMLITVPFIWDEHEQPFDYARYSSFGLNHILEKHGFEIIEFKKSANDIRAIFQLVNIYIYKKTFTKTSHNQLENKATQFFQRLAAVSAKAIVIPILVPNSIYNSLSFRQPVDMP